MEKRGEATAAVEDDEKPHRTHTHVQMKKKGKKGISLTRFASI